MDSQIKNPKFREFLKLANLNGVASAKTTTNRVALLPCLFLIILNYMWSHRAYQNHNILHVFKLLRVEEGCELLSVSCQIPV